MTSVIVKGKTVANESKSRMIKSAALLLSTRGATATSFSEVLGDSGAPRGSIYHHFPGGKNELTHDAALWTSRRVLAHLSQAPTTTPTVVLEYFIDMWRGVVNASGGAVGCAVAGVAVDTTPEEPLMGVVAEIFATWTETLADKLALAGLEIDRARSIATTALASMEGSLILCRARGTSDPLEVVAGELLQLVR